MKPIPLDPEIEKSGFDDRNTEYAAGWTACP
jgi:hypothetical protein